MDRYGQIVKCGTTDYDVFDFLVQTIVNNAWCSLRRGTPYEIRYLCDTGEIGWFTDNDMVGQPLIAVTKMDNADYIHEHHYRLIARLESQND